jgi:hypothetical protein
MAGENFIQTYWPQIVTLAGALAGYVQLKAKVDVLEGRANENKTKAEAAQIEAAKALGSHDVTNTRIGALERAVGELQASQSAMASRVEAAIREQSTRFEDLFRSLSSSVVRLREDVLRDLHKIDKAKVSTDQFRAISEDEAVRLVRDPRREP